MSQFLRPSSDVSAGTWIPNGGPASLFDAVNEVSASDTDFVSCGTNNNSTCEVALGAGSAPDAGTRTVRYRYQKSAAAGNARDLTVSLYQGATLVNEQAHTGISETWTDGSFAVAAAITDYADLRLRFTSGGTTGGPGGNRRDVHVSWAELEIPDAPAPPASRHFILT